MPFRIHIPLFIFITALCIYIYHSTVGLTAPLSDPHGFRQAQTAITTYYFLKDGVRLDYWTPALGPPWSIPMEFPLFQTIVAVFVKLTNTALDPAGRLISIFFFYAMLPLIYAILKNLDVSKNHRWVLLSFIVLCPTYLFWSRTFLIESLALTLCALYFFSIVKIHQTNRLVLFVILAIISGILASTVKITTFTLIIVPAIIFCFTKAMKKMESSKLPNKRLYLYKEAVIIIFIVGIPILVSVVWIMYADSLKSLNPLASGFLTSKDMTDWNYGTLTQKLSPITWESITTHIKQSVIGIVALILIPIITIPLNKKYRWHAILTLITFFLGLLIFTNLYATHDYYYYANSIYLMLSIGFAILGTFDHLKRTVHLKLNNILSIVEIISVLSFIFLLIHTYYKTYYPPQSNPAYGLVQVGEAIKKYTKEDDVVLVYGHVWSPEIPYYAQRKAIMDMWGLPLSNQKIAQSIALSNKDNITAMFVRLYPDEFVKERITYFNLSPDPVFISPWGMLYVKKL